MLGLDGLVRTLYAYWLCGYRALDRKDAGENLIVIAQPFELMIGKQKPVSRLLPSVHPMPIWVREKDKLLGILHRKRTKHDRIHDRENRGVGANAERQGNDNDRGESRPLKQTSNAIANVSKKCFHDHRDIGPISPIGPIGPIRSWPWRCLYSYLSAAVRTTCVSGWPLPFEPDAPTATRLRRWF